MYYHDPFFSSLPFLLTPLAVVRIALYLASSWGIYAMANNTGMKSPWMAWVPFAKDYLMGSLADRYHNTLHEKKTHFHLWLTLLGVTQAPLTVLSIMVFGVVLFLFSYAPTSIILLMVLSIFLIAAIELLYEVCYLVAFYNVVLDFEPNRAVLYTVLAFFGLGGVCLMLCRNNVPVGVAGKCGPTQPKYHVHP